MHLHIEFDSFLIATDSIRRVSHWYTTILSNIIHISYWLEPCRDNSWRNNIIPNAVEGRSVDWWPQSCCHTDIRGIQHKRDLIILSVMAGLGRVDVSCCYSTRKQQKSVNVTLNSLSKPNVRKLWAKTYQWKFSFFYKCLNISMCVAYKGLLFVFAKNSCENFWW